MNRQIVSAIMFTMLLICTLTLAFDIPSVKATGTIYITADGSVLPPTAPILRQGDLYTLTDNIGPCDSDGIVIQRDNIILDGAGFTLQGIGFVAPKGVYFNGRTGVTVRHMKIEGFFYGVFVQGCSLSMIVENSITNTKCGILSSSSGDTVCGNNITANDDTGISLSYCSNDCVYGNSITGNRWCGIALANCLNTTVFGNCITSHNYAGIYLDEYSENNMVCGNSIADNYYGVFFDSSSYNIVYHNSFTNNSQQVNPEGFNFFDNGFPSGGNYWSDYEYYYPGAVEIDDSGIWNMPYEMCYLPDNYPLMGPWTTSGGNVTVTPASGVSLTFANVTSGGITTVNETQSGPTPFPSYKIEGQYFDISTTASYSGNITIRLTYDDTNMTLQEEESLQLMHWNETSQQWEDITTGVDMESNVIYGETDHLSIFAVHSLLIHDLSIFGVHAFKTIIGQGYTLSIDVDVRNEGDFEETFDATIDLVSGQISYLSIFAVHMVNGNTMTLHFTWNTANNARDNYNIVAHVSQVPYEIDTSDNTYPDGTVTVTIPGDVTGDFYVNIKDAALLGANWGKPVPPAPANVDINGDGIINIKDAAIVGVNWQKHA